MHAGGNVRPCHNVPPSRYRLPQGGKGLSCPLSVSIALNDLYEDVYYLAFVAALLARMHTRTPERAAGPLDTAAPVTLVTKPLQPQYASHRLYHAACSEVERQRRGMMSSKNELLTLVLPALQAHPRPPPTPEPKTQRIN